MTESKVESASPTTIAHQMPIGPNIKGRTNTNKIWNTKVLLIEIVAETAPLFKAVKKEEEKEPIPQNKNATE